MQRPLLRRRSGAARRLIAQHPRAQALQRASACACTSCLRRIKELADKEEDVDKKMAMRKIFRTLQGVNDEVCAPAVCVLSLSCGWVSRWAHGCLDAGTGG